MKIIKILLFTCVVAVAKNHCKAADDGRPPDHYCPITLQVMMDPVVAADGISYEKYAIQEWLRNRNSSPVTRKIFNNTNIVENLALKRLIDDWKPGHQFKACEFETLDALTISQRVRHEFDQNADLFNVAKGKHIVAFLGNTGTGKSTLVNLLSGKQIMSADGQDYVLVDPGDLTATAIGTEGISVTLYPKFVDVGDFRYFDLPGFNDADGSFRNLVNSAFIRKIFMDAESVRLVIVVGQDQFTADRGVLVNQMFNSIGQLFVADQHADLIDESIFVATKVTFDFDGDRFIDFLLKKTNAGDKQILNNQLKLWGGKNRLHRMFHPIASTNGKIENLKKEINCSIRDTKQAKVLGINVSALFPPNTRDHLKRLFSNIMEGVLKCKFAQSLTTLSQYDAAIALCSCYEDFWGAFDRDVCQDELISLLKEFCISSYNEAFAKLINNAEGVRCHYIEDLIARRQERLKDIERRVDIRARGVISSLQMDEVGDDFVSFDFAYHKDFYDQICGPSFIIQLATDSSEQEVARRYYAGFIACHGHEQIIAWFARFAKKELSSVVIQEIAETITARQTRQALDSILTEPIIPDVAKGYEEVYLRFLGGKLIYRPKGGGDGDKFELPIAGLANPLEGNFDLTSFGNISQHISINTGYRKGIKATNESKLEIWFVPRFLIENEINTTASHFNDIMTEAKWPQTAAIGVFYTWGNWDNINWYDYLTTNTYDQLGNKNLYEKWKNALHHIPAPLSELDICSSLHDQLPPSNTKFQICFETG